MQIHELKSPKGSRKRKRIVGRGRGSGAGKTAGKGENGQRSRSGRGVLLSSEGGQMPLIRRIPKVGFRSHRPVVYQLVNLEELSRFKEGSVINAESLKSHGLIKSLNKPIKLLGDGEVKKAFTIQVDSCSKSAKEKLVKAGGKVEAVKTVRNKKAKAESKSQK